MYGPDTPLLPHLNDCRSSKRESQVSSPFGEITGEELDVADGNGATEDDSLAMGLVEGAGGTLIEEDGDAVILRIGEVDGAGETSGLEEDELVDCAVVDGDEVGVLSSSVEGAGVIGTTELEGEAETELDNFGLALGVPLMDALGLEGKVGEGGACSC